MALTDADNFYIDLVKIKNEDNFKQYCLAEKENIENNYNVLVTLKSVYSKYRKKALTYKFNLNKSNIIKEIFKLDNEEYNIIRKDYNLKVSSNLRTLKLIKSIDDYFTTSIKLIESSKILDNIVGLAALTGRRVAEIGCSAHFKYIKYDYVLFTGQLKTKFRENVNPYEIPVFYNAKNLINVLNHVRYEKPQYYNDPELFHNSCSKTISSITKKAYQDIIEGEVTPKDLRAIYACLANHRFNDGSIGITRYIADILGHDELDNNTCNSYIKYRIT